MQRSSKLLLSATLAAAAATALAIGCSKDDPTPDPGTSTGAATDSKLGTPKPPFAGEIPKGAEKVDDMEVGKYGGTFVVALAGNPKSFNPLLANETSTTEILMGPVYESCWDYDNKKQEGQPGLCESFTRSDDGLEYTFVLREGLRWSDGSPMTADDFEFSYKVITDPAVPNSVKDLFRQGDDAEGNPRFPTLTKVDARTFKFKLFEANALFHFAVGSLYVVPKARWEKAYTAGEFNSAMTLQTPPGDMVASGPFVISDFKTEERVVLTRNPHFWKVDPDGNRLPYLNRIIFVIVPDFNTSLLKFRNGDTDVLEVRPEDYETLKKSEKDGAYTVHDLGPAFNTNYLMFNLDDRADKDGNPYVPVVKQKWFGDKNFRKAVSHAIDRDGIVRTVLSGRGQPLWGFTSPGNKKWYPGDDKLVTYPYDLDKARELLTASGFVDKDGTLHDADGNPVEFTLITNSENSTRIAMLNVIKDDLKKLGINASIRPVPFNDVVTSMRDTRNFEGVLLGWGTGIPPDPAQSKNILLSSGRSHAWYPEQKTPATPWEARIDELVKVNSASSDDTERRKSSDEIYRIFSDELPQIMLVVAGDAVAARDNIGNLKASPLRPKAYWNVEQLFFKTPKKRR